MTTAERFRRRQRIEAALIILVGVIVFVTSYVNGQRDKSQQDCLVQNVQAINIALTQRARLSEKDSDAVREVIKSALSAQSRAQIQRAKNRYLAAQADVQEQRAAHPVPPFPTGRCN